ncbi:hypothetical protein [Maritimibacter sp. UBA3975]|uniref:hypothetical protein n=1 Tax=Maritimibacter sp. UBA3975 TaxID=1946833 RepID=UPI000C0B7027|nr:hypothetical protein [Maritimibacter sp. UBA3975]MAM62688.1 hypothetical protein [Maritimibacter sp.]|tara:strand:+ start:31074 stop:31673 length:600 start_codon:yes stop_codon:yes gene_type:complete
MKLALLACLVASPALATCPTRADLTEGVILVQNEPSFLRSDIEIRGAGLFEVRLMRDADENASAMTLAYAHALAPEAINDAGALRLRAYDPAVTTLDRLDEAGDLTFDLIERDEAGEETSARLLFNHLGTRTREILDCSYEVWTVREMTARPGGEITTRELEYAPDLGVLLAAHEIDAAGQRRAIYEYTWIGTAADVAR